MNRTIPKQLMLALALAAIFLSWSLVRWCSARDAHAESLASWERCQELIKDIRTIPIGRVDAMIAPNDYQPEADVASAAAQSGISTRAPFGVSHLPPAPIAGTGFSEVEVVVPQLELGLEQVFEFVTHLANGPVALTVRRIALSQATRAASEPDSSEELWAANFDIFYLVVLSPAPGRR